MSVETTAKGLPDVADPEYLRIIRNNVESTGARSMTVHSAPLEDGAISVLSIILVSARLWREARDTGLAIQPHLFATLAPEGGGVLAPVIDSLMHFYEIVLRRPMRVGRAGSMSPDEDLLLDLLTGTKQRRDAFGNTGGMGHAFDAALISTQIMVRKAFRLPAIA